MRNTFRLAGAKAALGLGLLSAAIMPSLAGSLQVMPVLVDVAAPGMASTVTLRNGGDRPSNAQIRIFRWTQSDGQDRLEPTQDVVASPPAVTLAPNTDYVVRVVRVAKRPLRSEESYRLFVDELPDPVRPQNGAVSVVVRQSIPVFFGAPGRTGPAVAWSVAAKGGRITVTARNEGERRLRISALTLRDRKGKSASFGAGLVGYALGRSTAQWSRHGIGRDFGSGGSVSISAQSDLGPVHASAPVHVAR